MKQITIDTTGNKETKIELEVDKKTDRIIQVSKPKSQNTLIIVEKILKKNKLSPEDLEKITVNTGPGSFTGTRVGVAIANALAFALKIKVNNKKLAIPKYS